MGRRQIKIYKYTYTFFVNTHILVIVNTKTLQQIFAYYTKYLDPVIEPETSNIAVAYITTAPVSQSN